MKKYFIIGMLSLFTASLSFAQQPATKQAQKTEKQCTPEQKKNCCKKGEKSKKCTPEQKKACCSKQKDASK